MAPKALSWSVLDASASTTSTNERCNPLFSQFKALRAHIDFIEAKIIFIQRVIEFFDALKTFGGKVLTQPKFARLEERVLKKIDQRHRELASVINNIVFGQFKKTTTTETAESVARDLNLMIKIFDKGVIERLKKATAKQIFAQINTAIGQISEIPPPPKTRWWPTNSSGAETSRFLFVGRKMWPF